MTKQAPLRLWYTAPAPTACETDFAWQKRQPLAGWEKWSLPLGNSYFGASVFGRIAVERVNVTENSFSNPFYWGVPHWGTGNGGTRTFGNLYFATGHETDKAENFVRDLTLDDAAAHVSYDYEGITYRREYIVSYPDRVLAVHFTAEKDGAPVSGKISLTAYTEIPFVRDYCIMEGDGGGRTDESYATSDRLVMRGVGLGYMVTQEGQLRAKAVGGTVSVSENGIRVENANEATFYFTCGTNYQMEARVFLESDPHKKLAPYADPHEAVTERLDKACEMTYAELYARHIADYRSLFDRVKLNIGYDEADLMIPTNILVTRYKNESRSAYLETLYYQYGRYLLIASSRPGGYPATLQGTWTAYDSSPWGSDYHHNINVQMNYWPSGIANLAECFLPYSEYAKAYLPKAKRIADEYIANAYPENLSSKGENGWALGTAALLYCITGTSAKDHSGPGTGAFTSLLFWDHYTYTGDTEYLREVAYPILRDMSLFLSKVLVEKDGKLLVKYSASPEQQNPDGSYYQTMGCAFDQQMVYENHRRVLESADILGITDDPLLEVIRSQIDRLDPVLIGLDGQIKEFREEEHYGDIGEYTHRHISHLVGLYPATIINKNTPEWLEGAKISLTKRSDKSTGWAAAHRLCAWARTGLGNRAYDLYYSMLKNNTLPNLWDDHPPFQIDGNFGAVAGISEMLLQSQAGYIDFLAALPDVWKDGSFDGLVARGNFVCGCDFTNGKVTEMRITARTAGKCRVKYAGIANAKISAPVSVLAEDMIDMDMGLGASVTISL